MGWCVLGTIKFPRRDFRQEQKGWGLWKELESLLASDTSPVLDSTLCFYGHSWVYGVFETLNRRLVWATKHGNSSDIRMVIGITVGVGGGIVVHSILFVSFVNQCILGILFVVFCPRHWKFSLGLAGAHDMAFMVVLLEEKNDRRTEKFSSGKILKSKQLKIKQSFN